MAIASSHGGGLVKEVAVKEGDHVAEGQVLVRFDTSELEVRRKELVSSIRGLTSAIENRKAFAQLPREVQNAIRESHPEVNKAEEAYARALSDFDAASERERVAAKTRLDIAAEARVTARAKVNQAIASTGAQNQEEMLNALHARLDEIENLIRTTDVRSPASGIVDLLKLHPGDRIFPSMPVAAIASRGVYSTELVVTSVPRAEPCRAILDDGRVFDCRVESTSTRTIPAALRETRDKSEEIVTRLLISTDQSIPPGTKADFQLP